MEQITSKVDELISEIKQGDIYQNYIKALSTISENEELKAKVDALREKNFYFQREGNPESMFEESSRLEEEFQELRRQPIVNEYLDTELALCKMLRRIGMRINTEMEIHLPI